MSGAYHTLHPMEFTASRETYESSFANEYGSFGMHVDAVKELPVHERLFTPSKGQARGPSTLKYPVSQAEIVADGLMQYGEYNKAIASYTQAISQKLAQKASLFWLLREAAYVHVGRYQDALKDARHIAANGRRNGLCFNGRRDRLRIFN